MRRFAASVILGATLLPAPAVQASEAFCAAPGSIAQCPKTCAAHCGIGSDLAQRFPEACLNATLLAERPSTPDDPASCAAQDRVVEAPPTKLDACLAKAESAKRPVFGREEVDAFLNEFPKCAPSIWALEQMYACLQAQTTEMQALYEKLDGYGLSKIDPKNRQQFCERDDAEIQTAEEIANRLNGLSVNAKGGFDKVSDCRSQIEKWLDESIEGCGDDEFCKAERDALIGATREQLEPAITQQNEVETIVGNVSRDLRKIMSVLRLRGLLCPPKS